MTPGASGRELGSAPAGASARLIVGCRLHVLLTAIGGVPTSSPAAQTELAYLSHEPEGIFRITDMLTKDRTDEGTIAANLRRTIKLCTANEDFGTETLLKGILLKVEDRAHHLDHFLGSDSLGLRLNEGASA